MSDFYLAIPTVLKNEGGYVWDVNDPGGETKYGISKRAYPDLDIKNLTREKAIEIYYRDFWKFDGVKDQAVATKIFDSYVNLKHTGIRILQECIIDPSMHQIDGVWGPSTCAAVNASDPFRLLTFYRAKLKQHYRNLVEEHPYLAKFLNGWLARAGQ